MKVAAAEWALAEAELALVADPAEALRNTAGLAEECRKAQVARPTVVECRKVVLPAAKE
ncbi:MULTISPECIES: hypothetical protein [unclassified Bradyrhizobium]|uniref:hypothetical protein n=1 Tax=unclassified Bradyrhizobium TaxID=2631580 RepID=UPI00247A2FEC|nr:MULTISPECIES: hypothetical protein [unclassified Bradyrhizobium]WGR69255.1 hypothetical protein MTX24_28025 [Bradyrhizobium sp. ISRA426]WGR81310.1 hypothetical protein MTX21_13140 [Bradyrhizobium sp. ISRA430]WGR84494.1 hypothetical protein MTX25_27705 [Bradyrhizobium sp. ISRA432]